MSNWGAPDTDQAFADDDEDRIAGLDMRFEKDVRMPGWMLRILAIDAKYESLHGYKIPPDSVD